MTRSDARQMVEDEAHRLGLTGEFGAAISPPEALARVGIFHPEFNPLLEEFCRMEIGPEEYVARARPMILALKAQIIRNKLNTLVIERRPA